MRLLFITQKIDFQDPILGFVHRWVEHLYKSFNRISVICLQKGRSELSSEVEITSLGKEGGVSRLKYLSRFYSAIWSQRKDYDAVFIHMNQEYVLLGAILWRMLGKKVFLWRNHPSGNFKTYLAVRLSHKVFCTSDKAYVVRWKKTKVMPAGIDTDFFKAVPSIKRKENTFLYVGRVDPIKNVDVLIEALALLDQQGKAPQVTILGDPSPRSEGYYQSLLEKGQSLVGKGLLSFEKGRPQTDMPALYSEYDFCVNLTYAGSFDKTVVEAMASGCISLFSNSSFFDLFSEQSLPMLGFESRNSESLAQTMEGLMKLSFEEKEKLRKEGRQSAIEKQSSKVLIEKLKEEMKS